MFNKKYSVFIAYHGTYSENGSCGCAKKIFDYLSVKGVSCFFFPMSNKNGNYKANIKEVLESNLFLLVCTDGIKKEVDGRINVHEHLDLYFEIDTFWGMVQIGEVKINDSMVVVVGEGFKKGAESMLHPMFQDRVGLFLEKIDEQALNDIYSWVQTRSNENAYLNDGRSFEIKKLYAKRNKIQIGKLQELINKAHVIKSIGISNSTICDMNLIDSITLFLKRGGCLDILFLDPDSENTRKRAKEEHLARENRIAAETKKTFDMMLDLINECDCCENAKMFLYDMVPRINALFIDNTLILQYYSYNNMGKDNPTLIIEKSNNNSPLFDYTEATFEYVRSLAIERSNYYAD